MRVPSLRLRHYAECLLSIHREGQNIDQNPMWTFWIILLCVFLGSILPSIIKWVLMIMFKMTEEEVKLRDEYRELKKQLSSISAIDEFARYARIQRKINAIEDKVKGLGQNRAEGRESLKWKWTKAIQIVNGAVLVFLAVTRRSEPVAVGFPSEWFWPIGEFLSYPSGIPGALSTVVWLLLCNNASRALIK